MKKVLVLLLVVLSLSSFGQVEATFMYFNQEKEYYCEKVEINSNNKLIVDRKYEGTLEERGQIVLLKDISNGTENFLIKHNNDRLKEKIIVLKDLKKEIIKNVNITTIKYTGLMGLFGDAPYTQIGLVQIEKENDEIISAELYYHKTFHKETNTYYYPRRTKFEVYKSETEIYTD
jgi:hypothetical protein